MRAVDDLAAYFQEGELEAVDLVRIDFSGLKLQGVGFRSSFLIEASLRNAIVDDCSFEGASLRNVDFTGASLQNADMRDADWFNAVGLTETQARSVKVGSLLPMPGSVEALHKYLAGRYGLPFESWTDEVKTRLTTAWSEYLKVGGLGQIVAKM